MTSYAATTTETITNLGINQGTTLKNGQPAEMTFDWKSAISGITQSTFKKGDVVTIPTNLGTIFDLDQPYDVNVYDAGGNTIAVMHVTETNFTLTFTQDAEDLGATSFTGSYDSRNHLTVKDNIQGATEVDKTLTVGGASLALKFPALTYDLKYSATGQGSISPAAGTVTLTDVEGSNSITITGTPDAGKELLKITLYYPDGTYRDIPVTNTHAAQSVTINKNELLLGTNKLVFTFTPDLGLIDICSTWKWAWPNTTADAVGFNVTVGNNAELGLKLSEGANLSSAIWNSMDNNANTMKDLIVEDTIPGKGQVDPSSISITANMAGYAIDSGTWNPGYRAVWDGSQAYNMVSAGLCNLLTQNAGESLDDFRTRIKGEMYSYGVYVDSTTRVNTVLVNLGSPGDKTTPGIKCSDIWKNLLDNDAELNKMNGDGNCVGGKVQWFYVNLNADHSDIKYKTYLTNTDTLTYTDGNGSTRTPSAEASYTVGDGLLAVPGKGYLNITKLDASDSSVAISEAKFKIQKWDGSAWVDYKRADSSTVDGTTDSSGQINNLGEMIDGKYKIVEVSAPGDYKPSTAVFTTGTGSAGTISADGEFEVAATQSSGFVAIVTNAKAYNVNYYANGGTGTLTDSNNPYANGGSYTVLNPSAGPITRDGYIFTGWNTKADGTGDDRAVGSSYTIQDADVNLYAQWKEIAASITITKVWDDNSDADSKRPSSITSNLKLYSNNGEGDSEVTSTPTITDNGDDTWTIKYSSLDKKDSSNHDLTYYIKETTVTGYSDPVYVNTATGYTSVTDKAYEGATITNTIVPTTTASIEILKAVAGDEPKSYPTFTFSMAEGSGNDTTGYTMPDTTTASVQAAATAKTATFNDITFTKPGTYTFDITETTADANGWVKDGNTVEAKVVVTNTAGVLSTDVTYSGGTGTDGNTITNTFHKVDATMSITKHVAGNTPPSYPSFNFTLANVTGDADGFTMPATVTKSVHSAATDVTESFSAVSFYKAGTYTFTATETTADAGGWVKSNSPVTYKVVVTDTNGTLAIDADASTLTGTITNTYTPGVVTQDPPIQKIITGGASPSEAAEFIFTMTGADGAPMPAAGTYTAADGTQTTTTYDAGSNTLTASHAGAGGVEFGNITFDTVGTYVYTLDEDNNGVAGYNYDDNTYTMTVVVTDNAGQLEKNVTYTDARGNTPTSMSFSNEYDPKTSIRITKVWLDNDDAEGIRPDEVTVVLKQDDIIIKDNVVLSAANNWVAEWDGELPITAADGHDYVYTVEEPNVPDGYTCYVRPYYGDNNFYVMNYHGAEGSISVNKVWDDNNDRYGKRPDTVTVGLFNKDTDEQFGSDIVLMADASGAYTYTWNDVPMFATGSDAEPIPSTPSDAAPIPTPSNASPSEASDMYDEDGVLLDGIVGFALGAETDVPITWEVREIGSYADYELVSIVGSADGKIWTVTNKCTYKPSNNNNSSGGGPSSSSTGGHAANPTTPTTPVNNTNVGTGNVEYDPLYGLNPDGTPRTNMGLPKTGEENKAMGYVIAMLLICMGLLSTALIKAKR